MVKKKDMLGGADGKNLVFILHHLFRKGMVMIGKKNGMNTKEKFLIIGEPVKNL